VVAAAARTLRAITSPAHLPTILALARAYARSGLAPTRVAALGLLEDLAPDPHSVRSQAKKKHKKCYNNKQCPEML
jgi:hypothetical protein